MTQSRLFLLHINRSPKDKVQKWLAGASNDEDMEVPAPRRTHSQINPIFGSSRRRTFIDNRKIVE